jgi:hypothetical protein
MHEEKDPLYQEDNTNVKVSFVDFLGKKEGFLTNIDFTIYSNN